MVCEVKRRNEETLEGVVTYLSSDLFPGIGKATATKVFNELGPNCLQRISADKKVLDETDLTAIQKDTIYNNLITGQAQTTQKSATNLDDKKDEFLKDYLSSYNYKKY